MNNKKILNITTLIILILVPFLKFFSMSLEYFNVMNNYDNINPSIILYVCLPILMYIYISDIKIKKRKLDLYDFIIYGITFVSIISTFFAPNRYIAIFGKSFRHEGLLSVLCYLYLFLNWKINGNREDVKKYVKVITILAIINSIYSLFQIYTNFNFILRYKNGLSLTMASGFLGNPNFFGSLLVTSLSILTYKLFLKEYGLFKNIIIIVLLFIALINCQSTGPMLTYIIIILFLFIYAVITKCFNVKKFFYLTITLTCTFLFISYINSNLSKMPNKTDELSMQGIGETIKSGGNGRLDIWKNSFDVFKKYPLFGVGYDNFYLAYPNEKPQGFLLNIVSGEFIKNNHTIVICDNAHNVYIHQLVSCGLFGFILYSLLYLLVFIKGLTLNNTFILFGGFLAYSIQAFANINVVQVTPIYYLIMGLILCSKE